MEFKIKDRRTNRFLDESDIEEFHNIFIGLNGKPYKITSELFKGDECEAWLDVNDVSDYYSVYLVGIDLAIETNKYEF